MKISTERCRVLLLCWTLLACAAQVSAQTSPILIKYRTIATIYVDAGNAEGLESGDRLEVLRDGLLIAELEVLRLAEHSASCRALVEHAAVEVGDEVRRRVKAEVEPAQAIDEQPVANTSESTQEESDTQPRRAALARIPAATPVVVMTPPDRLGRRRRRSNSPDYTRLSGSLTVNWESFVDASELGRDTDRTGARLSLRVDEIGGWPLEFRARASTREIVSTPTLLDSEIDRTTKNRFYEASLLFDPPVGKYGFQIGRMRSGEFAGVGGLDGGIGRYALSPAVQVGLFAGSRPDIEQLAADVGRLKYGIFARYMGEKSATPVRAFVAAVREEGEEGISREFLAFNLRFQAGERWSFYQRAEADFNNDWRADLADSSSQLSNYSLTARAELTESSRLLISYTRIERYRTEETRRLPEEVFDDAIRQGLRVTVQGRFSENLRFGLNAGLRNREGEEAQGYSFGASLSHGKVSPLGLAVSASLIGFSNGSTEGTVLNLRTSKRLGRGHRLGLTLGGRVSTNLFFEETKSTTQWARLSGWLELPGALFGTAEYELTTGDQLEGQRLSTSLGYRF